VQCPSERDTVKSDALLTGSDLTRETRDLSRPSKPRSSARCKQHRSTQLTIATKDWWFALLSLCSRYKKKPDLYSNAVFWSTPGRCTLRSWLWCLRKHKSIWSCLSQDFASDYSMHQQAPPYTKGSTQSLCVCVCILQISIRSPHWLSIYAKPSRAHYCWKKSTKQCSTACAKTPAVALCFCNMWVQIWDFHSPAEWWKQDRVGFTYCACGREYKKCA
jgi:hypothetical protein